MTPDVVIVGAGPVGLMLGCELALAGVRPLVLERLAEPVAVPKANGMVGQVVRLLDHRGLYARCNGRGATPQALPEFFFGAMPLPLAKIEANPLFAVMIPQPEIERVFAERAAELGVEVQRSVDVMSLAQDAEGVTLRVKSGAAERELRTAYVVGCDGGHSTIRRQLGVAFPGISTDNLVSRGAYVSARSMAEIMARARSLSSMTVLKAGFNRTERGVFVFGTLQADRPLVNTLEWEVNRDGEWPGGGAPMTLGEMGASISRVIGVELPALEPPPPGPTLLRRLIGRNTRLAERYRVGRVFLAGDAAHVHAASGGPGLNLGLQDAANLAWKLAAAIRGWAPASLLDSYERERHAAGARVFMQTQAQTALMAPGGDVTALRQLFGELLQRPENAQHIANLMAGTDVRYDMGDGAAHAWTGHFVPDLVLRTSGGSRRLAELMREGRPLVIDWSTDGALREVARGWRDRVALVGADERHAPARAALIRPDGYVAWAADGGDDAAVVARGLGQALSTWFGAPAAA
ncbi:MAG TPA: FAD-dependent monooxygenase [Polyangia bacterium]|nr:FAD-dependent monooxygenase [Polyangia bacterium]